MILGDRLELNQYLHLTYRQMASPDRHKLVRLDDLGQHEGAGPPDLENRSFSIGLTECEIDFKESQLTAVLDGNSSMGSSSRSTQRVESALLHAAGQPDFCGVGHDANLSCVSIGSGRPRTAVIGQRA